MDEINLVMDNGGHWYAILHELRFVLAKNSTLSPQKPPRDVVVA